MKTANDLRLLLACGLMFAATFPASAGETAYLRVAYLDNEAGQALYAGRPDQAIEFLEAQLADETYERQHGDLSTLCAAYILENRFSKAQPVCNEAVKHDDSDMAFNNRGVLRAHLGDFNGALQDFARIRVAEADIEGFLEQLARGNARLIATDNFEIIERVSGLQRKPAMSLSRSSAGAEIEEIGN